MEQTPQQLEQQRKALEMEELRLRVLEMQEREAARKAKIDNQMRLAKQVAADEQLAREKVEAEQRYCKHRKGGKDRQGIANGNATDYSVIHHIYPNGQEWVQCTRCMKTVKPGDPEYAEWMRFPTDNETSASVTFSNLRG